MAGAAKRLCWEPFAFAMIYFDGQTVPWAIRSAFLMLYFVLNLTAASDFLTGFCLLLGTDVDEIFDAPLLSRSPRDFWSRRWNKFINRFALKHVAMPIGRHWSAGGVILAVFSTSGLFHEYFAWGVGGAEAVYGSMMVFFVLQGIVVLLATRLRVRSLPHPLGTVATFAWMTLTAPLFFLAVRPALLAFGYPTSWLPF
jgi:D-alanyl-lipoteichoic acid acyltransferase DltB (MBOAT superfamily)